MLISGKQSWRQAKLKSEVDIMVTDSPLILGAVYAEDCKSPEYANLLKQLLVMEMEQYDNVHIFLNRVKPYNPKGRNQTEEEAIQKDDEIKQLLLANSWQFVCIDADDNAARNIITHLEQANWL